jgi:hypothetical protein
MNIELRSKVLEESIQIENTLSVLLSHLLQIKKDTSLTLGIKSTSLSFSSKVDLLRDLNRISAEEQKDCRLFMEIRNKLIHNLSIDTMLKALNSIDAGKIQQLIRVDREVSILFQKCQTNEEKEDILFLAFHCLATRINKIFLTAMQILGDEWNKQQELEKSRIAVDILNCLGKAIDEFSDIFDTAYLSGTPEELGLAKKGIHLLFKKQLEKLNPVYKLSEGTGTSP